MLVSAAEMLKKAKAGHYAVGQFNINNLEWTKAALLTAEECKSPHYPGRFRRRRKIYVRFQNSSRYGKGHDGRTEHHCTGSSSLRPWYI